VPRFRFKPGARRESVVASARAGPRCVWGFFGSGVGHQLIIYFIYLSFLFCCPYALRRCRFCLLICLHLLIIFHLKFTAVCFSLRFLGIFIIIIIFFEQFLRFPLVLFYYYFFCIILFLYNLVFLVFVSLSWKPIWILQCVSLP